MSSSASSKAEAELRLWLPGRGFQPFTSKADKGSVASDGMIYYVLSSHSLDVGAQMFAYNPASGAVLHLGDITAAAGEAGIRAIPQGKSHVRFVESNGKLFFATTISPAASSRISARFPDKGSSP